MEESKTYSPKSLGEVTNPPPGLNPNNYGEVTKKERLGMIVSSKTFTVAASVFTLGFYYLYYLFCLEQEQDNPFFIGKEERKKDKYKYERPEEANAVYQEALGMNKRLANFASSKENKAPIKKRLCQGIRTKWERAKLIVSVHVSNLLSWLESTANFIWNQEWKVERQEEEKEEKKLQALIKSKIEKISNQKEEDEEMEALDISLTQEYDKPKKDHYLTFIFYSTYFLLSLVTLGLFPVYHLCVRNRWDDFQVIKKHKEHSSYKEFNDLTSRLVGTNETVEYSYLLLSKRGLPLHLNFFSNVFRTKVFNIRDIRKKIITFLMIITLGFFGVFILAKNVFDENKLTINDDNIKPTNYSKIENKWERFKFFLLDLFRDIDMAGKIAAKRVSTINRSVTDLLTGYNKDDHWMIRFVRILSSELYYWLFAFLYICTSLTFLIVYANWYSDFYNYFLFWLVSGLFAFFLGLFTRHIRLLFV